MDTDTKPCSQCGTGTMRKDGDMMKCDNCGHTELAQSEEKM